MKWKSSRAGQHRQDHMTRPNKHKYTRSTNKCVRLWRAAVGWWIERIDLNSNTLDYEPIRLLLLLIKRPLWNEQMQVVIGRRSVFNTKSSITFKKYYWYGAQNRCDYHYHQHFIANVNLLMFYYQNIFKWNGDGKWEITHRIKDIKKKEKKRTKCTLHTQRAISFCDMFPSSKFSLIAQQLETKTYWRCCSTHAYNIYESSYTT